MRRTLRIQLRVPVVFRFPDGSTMTVDIPIVMNAPRRVGHLCTVAQAVEMRRAISSGASCEATVIVDEAAQRGFRALCVSLAGLPPEVRHA